MIYGTIAGRIVRDAELRHTEKSTVLGFTVACDIGFGEKKHAVFVKCSMWGKRGEAVSSYVKKGGQVTVIGGMDLREWESNEKSGTDLELNVTELILQGGNNAPVGHDHAESGTAKPAGTGFREQPQDPGFTDNEIPF
jgi:single-strand DNA-binding protein